MALKSLRNPRIFARLQPSVNFGTPLPKATGRIVRSLSSGLSRIPNDVDAASCSNGIDDEGTLHHQTDQSSSEFSSDLVGLLVTTSTGTTPLPLGGIHVPTHDVPWWDASIYVCDVVHWIHDTSGMNYAASIAAITVLGRLCLVPVSVWHLRNNPWEPQMLQLKGLHDRAVRGRDVRAQERYRAEIEYLRSRHPRWNRLALPLASVGGTLFMWIGLRRMGALYPSELATGGAAWFVDLTQPDPTLFLPILSSVLLYSIHELGADELGRPRKEWLSVTDDSSRLWRYGVRVFQVGVFSVWFFVPCSNLCFWIPHAMGSCLQGIAFSQPAVVQALGFGQELPQRLRGTTAASGHSQSDPTTTFKPPLFATRTSREATAPPVVVGSRKKSRPTKAGARRSR